MSSPTRRWHRTRVLPAVISVALAAGACASAVPGYTPTERKVTPDTAGVVRGATYTLSAEEQKLDCKKLTGRMQVRILQIRDRSERPGTNPVAKAAQSVAAPVLGGSTYGMDRERHDAEDRAMLEAYNRQLGAKGCPMFDLEHELKPKPATETPRPVPREPARKS